MSDDSAYKEAGMSAREVARLRSTSRFITLVSAIVILLLITVITYLLWPRTTRKVEVVEKPPTLEGKPAAHEGEEHHDEHNQEGAIEVNQEMAELVGLKVEPVVESEIEESIQTTGRVLVAPNQQAIIGAKVDGRAVNLLVEPGASVRAGQVLAVIESPQIAELHGQLIEAQARLKLAEQARARSVQSESRVAVIQAKNKLDLAQATLERKRRLASLGATPDREVAEAETEYQNAKAAFDYESNVKITREQQEAESEVAQTSATVTRLSQSIAALGGGTNGNGTISITSPIAGTVVDRHISIGETVGHDKELFTVMNLANVIIEAQLPESQASRVRIGGKLIARIPSLPNEIFTGKVETIGNTVDAEKRTVAVRAKVANLRALLKHEMALDIRIVTGAGKNALLVPVSALVDEEGIKVVYVKEGEKYERRVVTIGATDYQSAEILSGVAAGEDVVSAGAYQLGNMRKGGGEEGEHHDD